MVVLYDVQPGALAYINSAAVEAQFYFTQLNNGIKIDINVLKNFPNITDQYPYHIHQSPVAPDCTSTKKHLDPFDVNPNGNSTTYSCKMDDFSTCEVGDLSGKFGKLKGSATSYTLFDPTLPKVSELVGQRSIVIHLNDAAKTRIGCATIEDIDE